MSDKSSPVAATDAVSAAPFIDPDMVPVLQRMTARMAERPAFGTSTPVEMRLRFNADVTALNVDPPPLARVENLLVPTGKRDVPVRLYSATASRMPNATLIFYHGGGWVVGDLESTDRALRLLALHSGVTVISVDYCLAPEHKFPQPLDECREVACWIHEHGAPWGVDSARIAVGGESAGANLALATALDLRDGGANWLRSMLLIYGAYVCEFDHESHRLFGGGNFGFGTQAMRALWSMYLARPEEALDPRAAPMHARLANLPPAYVVAGGLDPLRDDSRRMAARLIGAGNTVEYFEYPGVVHGFMGMTRELGVTRRATVAAANALRRVLNAPPAEMDVTK